MSLLANRRVVLWVFVGLILLTVPFLRAWPRKTTTASAAPPAAAQPPAVSLSPALLSSQILEVHSASLTDYLAGPSPVQGVQPRADQRGVGIDGSLRAGSSFPLHLAGNPFESSVGGTRSLGGVNLVTGGYEELEVDLLLPSEGVSWSVGRSYNSRQGAGTSNGPMGRNWFQTSQLELVRYFAVSESTKNSNDLLYLVYGAERFIEFKRDANDSNEFKGKNGAAGGILWEEDSSGPDTYTYTDQHGWKTIFFGYDSDSNPAKGQCWKLVDPDGNEAFVGHASDKDIAIAGNGDPLIPAGYDDGGRLQTAYDPAGRRWSYTYNAHEGTVRLDSVKAETKSTGNWFDETYSGLTEVGKVEYSYYLASDTYGGAGDLKLVKITTPLSDTGASLVTSTRKKYYRYYEGTFNSTTNPGHDYEIKLVVDFEGVRGFDWTDSSFDEDFFTATDPALASYTSKYFEYESNGVISTATLAGGCGSCGGGPTEGGFSLGYETNTNPNITFGSGYDTHWKTRTIVANPDGSWLTSYFDEVGQGLHYVVTEDDPANNPSSKWVTKVTRNSDGCVTEIATPANVTGYTHAVNTFAITTSTSVGLVRTYVRDTSSGDMRGFLLDEKFKTGTSGTAYFEGARTYTSASKLIKVSGNVSVVRPLILTTRQFPVATSSPTSGDYNETTYSYTMYSGELAIQELTESLPAVSTTKNGSGASTARRQHFTKWGSRDWYEAENDTLQYWHYANGLVVDHIIDVDTANSYFDSSRPIPSGWSSTSGSVHRKESYTYDAQGRIMLMIPPAGPTRKAYYTRLLDEKLVTLLYPKYVSGSTPTYHGPVDYKVYNHAGMPTVSATVSIGAQSTTLVQANHVSESTDDILQAVDDDNSPTANLGEVVSLTTHIYDAVGTNVTVTREYFAIPSSGAGQDGTHYDAVAIDYDEGGRRSRVKTADGTVTRIVHDSVGRASAHWVGTDDTNFSESSGGGNMVKTEETVYDSGSSGGNSYVTKRTAFVQDSSTNKRETLYANDVRGQVLLVTNPTAPHVFYKLDNLGRTVAVGMFSSTTNIAVADDNPVLETDARLALDESEFNERGWVWKTKRHKIDMSNGASTDNYENYTWYDVMGQVTKQDADELVKLIYDRLGRVTHSFALAKDNDTAYADADDVAGDHVLLEEQTTYDSAMSDNIVIEATISRHHDDLATGNTGALDTNADGNALRYTAANVKGRLQIAASWYDELDRLVDVVEYGTNGTDSYFERSSSAPPRSDTALRTTYTYNYDGRLSERKDPRGLSTYSEFDALGRKTKVIRNYVDGTPSGPTYHTVDDDNIVRTVYVDGLETQYWVDLDGDGTQDTDDQVTTYTYGTTKGTADGDSKIATGYLLKKVAYPDSSGPSDTVSFAYNALSETFWRQDQDGNIIETEFDAAGRETARKVKFLDGDFDGAVMRIVTSYDNLGRESLVTQYSAVSGGSVVDEVKFTYDQWGNVEKLEQDNDSTVANGSNVAAYAVSYDYAKNAGVGRNTVRRTKMTLPGGERVDYQYLTSSNRLDGYLSRVTRIRDIGPVSTPPAVPFTIVEYKYNGIGELVGTEYPESSVKRERFGTTSGTYTAFDNFNRIKKDTWVKDLSTDSAIYDCDLFYDRNSNIVRIDDHVHKTKCDVVYAMDGLNRLADSQEGDLNGGSTIATESRQQTWTLTQTGNWDLEKLDLNGDGDWGDTDEHQDNRDHNRVNEITTRDTNNDNAADFTLSYDGSGNLTNDGEDYKYEYDAFYRLRWIYDQGDNPIAEYRYNGLGFRIAEHTDTSGNGVVDSSDVWHHFAHDERWRVVAMFENSEANPKEQFVHHAAGQDGLGGASYIDEIVLRDRDAVADINSTLDERLYYLQNRHFDVVALVDDLGKQVEMVRYSSYGIPFGLPGGDTDSDGDCDVTDQGNIQSWIGGSYDVRGDLDLDGDIDGTDHTMSQSAPYSGVTTGWRSLTGSAANTSGQAGYLHCGGVGLYCVRNRMLHPSIGRWLQRDPLDYVDGANMYQLLISNPIFALDPSGLSSKTVALPPVGPSTPPIVCDDKCSYDSDCAPCTGAGVGMGVNSAAGLIPPKSIDAMMGALDAIKALDSAQTVAGIASTATKANQVILGIARGLSESRLVGMADDLATEAVQTAEGLDYPGDGIAIAKAAVVKFINKYNEYGANRQLFVKVEWEKCETVKCLVIYHQDKCVKYSSTVPVKPNGAGTTGNRSYAAWIGSLNTGTAQAAVADAVNDAVAAECAKAKAK